MCVFQAVMDGKQRRLIKVYTPAVSAEPKSRLPFQRWNTGEAAHAARFGCAETRVGGEAAHSRACLRQARRVRPARVSLSSGYGVAEGYAALHSIFRQSSSPSAASVAK